MGTKKSMSDVIRGNKEALGTVFVRLGIQPNMLFNFLLSKHFEEAAGQFREKCRLAVSEYCFLQRSTADNVPPAMLSAVDDSLISIEMQLSGLGIDPDEIFTFFTSGHLYKAARQFRDECKKIVSDNVVTREYKTVGESVEPGKTDQKDTSEMMNIFLHISTDISGQHPTIDAKYITQRNIFFFHGQKKLDRDIHVHNTGTTPPLELEPRRYTGYINLHDGGTATVQIDSKIILIIVRPK